LALDAFVVMKKNEGERVQLALKTKEKERAELSIRLKTLPQDLEKALKDKKESTQKEAKEIHARITALEAELAAPAKTPNRYPGQSHSAGGLASVASSKNTRTSLQHLKSQEQILNRARSD